jgi:hypothetical protein
MRKKDYHGKSRKKYSENWIRIRKNQKWKEYMEEGCENVNNTKEDNK